MQRVPPRQKGSSQKEWTAPTSPEIVDCGSRRSASMRKNSSSPAIPSQKDHAHTWAPSSSPTMTMMGGSSIRVVRAPGCRKYLREAPAFANRQDAARQTATAIDTVWIAARAIADQMGETEAGRSGQISNLDNRWLAAAGFVSGSQGGQASETGAARPGTVGADYLRASYFRRMAFSALTRFSASRSSTRIAPTTFDFAP